MLSGMRLSEATLHGWDVRVAFDPGATLTGQEADAGLEQLTGPLSFMVGFMGKPDALGGTQATLREETTDPHRVLGLVLVQTVCLSDARADVEVSSLAQPQRGCACSPADSTKRTQPTP
jgi:hypothetical protein